MGTAGTRKPISLERFSPPTRMALAYAKVVVI
jgi:hypothetical protein